MSSIIRLPNAYQYRDYVIRALNADVPYNQFVVEHVAGDLLEHPRLHPKELYNESILGTGFWFLGEEVHSPVDVRQDEADRFDNRLDVMGKTFLGLTVACARCHDHKFDAISTKDYYGLAGFLQSSNYRLVRFESLEQNRRVAAELAALRVRARAAAQAAWAEALQPLAGRLSGYLLGAHEVIQAAPAGDADKQKERLAAIARERMLEVDVLRSWVDHLRKAAGDEHDPFQFWARVATELRSGTADEVTALIRSYVAAGTARAAEADRGLKVVVDYAHLGPDDWLPDGVSFGPGPQRPGAVRVSGTAERPVVQLNEIGAAAFDPVWNGLKAAPNSEMSPGAISSSLRPGRTIRTPKFTLESGKVYYLVRGSAQVYFSVASHGLIAGPLHGRLVTSVKSSDRFRWLGHDLAPYKGLRLNVQFTATSPDFAVAAVVQADQAPRLAPAPDAALRRALAGADSLESLAANYQSLLVDVTGRLAADHLCGGSDAEEYAHLTNWLLAHPGLAAGGRPARLPAGLRRARRGAGEDRSPDPHRIAPGDGDAGRLRGGRVRLHSRVVQGAGPGRAAPLPRSARRDRAVGRRPRQRAPGAGPADHRSHDRSLHRPGVRQPSLAPPVRAGHRGVGRQLRRPGRGADAPRVARLPGRSVRARRLVDEAGRPVHGAEPRLPDVVPSRPAGGRGRPGQPAAAPGTIAAAGGGGDPRCPAGRERPAGHDACTARPCRYT